MIIAYNNLIVYLYDGSVTRDARCQARAKLCMWRATFAIGPAFMALSTAAFALGPAPSGPDLRFVSPPASDAANQVANPVTYPTGLYPAIEPYEEGMLDVGDGHQLHYDVSGNPDGVPCVFLHGGPGAGCSPRCRRFFDPSFYKIVVFDQRGSGLSKPNAADDLDGSLVENTTPKLVGDIEALRKHLNIAKWGLVLGGSWGSTLALAYAQQHPTCVSALLLRGVFLFGPDEVEYLFCSGGTFGQNPQAWENYKRFLKDTSDSKDSNNLYNSETGQIVIANQCQNPRTEDHHKYNVGDSCNLQQVQRICGQLDTAVLLHSSARVL